ncbi:aldehyde dehydrogenase family protein [Advenella mimigardefordensis]|uniref:Aldehyde dehydrogenase n=1 Tax=Advenella mimigardefordensis (strain DSM 17166 / LMG 22922 / DPN7) TaxID=1247726 RepID=W0PB83_ADVMD|nr:aldehyde dehydrogenase family protein [Advenella mimigardefordensis]AHG64129.1 aldehyde dehydrogenase [Advenella mimigardefordensis DPN7]
MTENSTTAQMQFLSSQQKQHFIDGKWRPALSGETIDTYNPATGKVLATLAKGSREDVDLAVQAARRAFQGPWSRFTPFERYTLMLRVCDVLDQHFDELATIESMDMGAPISRTRAMKNSLFQTIKYFASQAMNWSGTTIPNSLKGDFTTLTLKAPVGVIGSIIPWNAPLISMWWTIGGTLATGCTTVIKTAEDASLTTLRTAELLVEAGVPPGVVNVVTGLGAEAGAALAEHMDVDRICFTGSTMTGREIIKASAGNMKRIQLELGGKSPDIVFADADLEKAVPGAAMGVYNNSGQICSAGTRIFVQRGIYDEFVEKLAAFTRGIKVGDPFDPASQLGPLISGRQLERVMEYMTIGQEEGASLVTGGTRLGAELAEGYFVQPTVFSDVHNDMRIAREEIFGPVASVIPFDTVDDALRLANDTIYGLGGAVWTTNVGTMMAAMNGIQAGKIWINCYGLADPAVGFSGCKQSGYGMKGGAQHIDGFLYEKSVYINGN